MSEKWSYAATGAVTLFLLTAALGIGVPAWVQIGPLILMPVYGGCIGYLIGRRTEAGRLAHQAAMARLTAKE